MSVAAGKHVTIPRCLCGREVCELLEPATGAGCPSGALLRLSCTKCRDLVVEFYFGKRVRPGRLVVVHTLDLDTGKILPDEADVIMDFERGNRSPGRGGTVLEKSVLTNALTAWRTAARGRASTEVAYVCVQ